MEGGEVVNDKDIVHLWKVMSNQIDCQSIYGPIIGGPWVDIMYLNHTQKDPINLRSINLRLSKLEKNALCEKL